VHRLLADPSYRRRAEDLRDWAAANDGSSRAADALEAFAEAPSALKSPQSAG
jgi:UDP:flavonoid glycosyltransferase YjiC (YdhE family)